MNKEITVNQRFIEAIFFLIDSNFAKNKSKIALEIGTTPQYLNEILTGRMNVSADLLQVFFNKYPISPEFVFGLSNEKVKLISSENTDENVNLNVNANVKPSIKKGNESGNKSGNKIEKNTINLVNLEPSKNLIHIPITDLAVAAGSGAINGDTIEVLDTIQLPKSLIKSGTHLCVRIKGNSMSPTMHDGGYAVIRLIEQGKWIEAKDEQVYVITNIQGEAYVKRLKIRLKQGFVVCMSDNPDKNAFANFNLQHDEINTIWVVEWYFTAKLPNIHNTFYNRVTGLEDEMFEIKQQLNQVLSRLP